MSIQLGVNLGPSFAEYGLVDTKRPKQPLAFRRCFVPTETIAGSLRRFLEDYKSYKIERLIIASNLLEKILDTKLGGSVAQIVTQGFENWPLLRQNLQHRHFELQPQRTEALASQDLIFGIKERINYQGEVITPLELDELDAIAAKLKAREVQRVCVNLLFSAANPIHRDQVCAYFQERGFEVYSCDEKSAKGDEILGWRKNVLNASLSGTFKDVRGEIIAGSEGHLTPEQIYFFDSDSTLFSENKELISSSLHGPAQAMAEFYSDQVQVLVLGIEKWYFLKPSVKKSTWQSPWGPLAGKVPDVLTLRLQPTTELITDEYEDLNWGNEVIGFEPGPMSFGRAFKPLLFDLLYLQQPHEDFSSFVSASGLTKFRDALTAMKKNLRGGNSSDIGQTVSELFDYLVDQIGLQVMLEREQANAPVLCSGIFTPIIYPLLKKRWPEIPWELCPFSREAEALSVATRGIA